MTILALDRCCDRCRHSTFQPCPDRILCLVNGPVCHSNEACRERARTRVAELRHDHPVLPVLWIGTATCGRSAGAVRTRAAIEDWLLRNNQKAEIVEVGCLGLCAAEPLLDVQLPGRTRLVFHHADAARIPAILEGVFQGSIPSELVLLQHRGPDLAPWPDVPFLEDHPFFRRQTRLLMADCGILSPDSIEAYMAHGGYSSFSATLRNHTPDEVCDIIEQSGLRGRGGRAFPVGRKWRITRDTVSASKYLICNADEGDPGSFMDRALIESNPHLLLEGIACSAYAIGARKAYIYIRAEYPLAVKRLELAIAQARAYGLIGSNILDSGFSFDLSIETGAGAFVCGEETALIQSIEGRRGMPRPRPPHPARQGLFGKPTAINNVETLANIPGILLRGSNWFRSMGSPSSTGTKLLSISGKTVCTGTVEVQFGITLRDVLFDLAGGMAGQRPFKAVLTGGQAGGCLQENDLDVKVDYEAMEAVGSILGSGGLIVLNDSACVVDIAKSFMDFAQRESCGKCIPCREGTRRMLDILQAFTRGARLDTEFDERERTQGVSNLISLAETLRHTSLCGLGQTAANPVLSLLKKFRPEFDSHILDRKCPAGICAELIQFRIDQAACTGCMECAAACPSHAILGARKSPHYIVQEKCITCGLCQDTCRYQAVLKE